MVNIKLGDNTYENVEKVKLDTPEGGTVEFAPYEEAFADGRDMFWNLYQQNGKRTAYMYGFANWPAAAINPKYDIICVGGVTSMFANAGLDGFEISLPEIATECGIKFDFSGATTFANFASWSKVVDFGFIDTTGCENISSGFANASSLKRASFAIKEDGSQNFSGAFSGDYALEDFTVVSGYFGSNLNFVSSDKLTTASVQSILDHLKDLTGQAANTLAFHADVGAKLTEAQKAAITAKNWTLVY